MSKELPVVLRNWFAKSHTSEEELKKILLHWRFTEACSLHYPLWKKFETTRTLPRAGLLAKLSNWWRRGLVILVTKNLMVTLVELHDHICRGEKPTEGQTSLQHSTDLGFMAVWPNSILSSVNTHENTHGICKKAPKGPSDSEKQDSLVWWTSILSIMFETSSAHRLQSIIPKVKCAGSSLMLWGCCSAAGTEGLVKVEEKLNAQKILRWP